MKISSYRLSSGLSSGLSAGLGAVRRRSVVAACLVSLAGLGACAVPYGEDKLGMFGGYSDEALEDGLYRVAFSGNGYTPLRTANDYLMLRAAELTLEEGGSHFEVVNRSGGLVSSTVYYGNGGAAPGTPQPQVSMIIRVHVAPDEDKIYRMGATLHNAASMRLMMRERHGIED